MPNHVINEVNIFGVDKAMQHLIERVCLNADGVIDFAVLLPQPLNSWHGNVGNEHKIVFPFNDLGWCAVNWGTKWNAYGKQKLVFESGVATLTFRTAWSAPYGWLLALFNTLRATLTSSYLEEGGDTAYLCTWTVEPMMFTRTVAPHNLQDHLHTLLWGCTLAEMETLNA